jgi:hypothetical protein
MQQSAEQKAAREHLDAYVRIYSAIEDLFGDKGPRESARQLWIQRWGQ